MNDIKKIINYNKHPIDNPKYVILCKNEIEKNSILVLKTEEDVKLFENKFMVSTPSSLNIESGDLIDWERVCEKYKGIEVHIVEYEGMNKWLSRWDVRQGCIWDPTCLNEEITLLAEKISDEKKDSLLEGARRLSENYDYEDDDFDDDFDDEMPDWMKEELGDEFGSFDKFSELKNYIRKKSSIFSESYKDSVWRWHGYKNIL